MTTTIAGHAPASMRGVKTKDWATELAPFGERKLKVVWDISNKCNLRCRMCHFSYNDVFYRPSEYMTPEVFENLAMSVLPNAHTLILSAGNEPLTSPWFCDILKIASHYGVPNFLFITNATRLSKKIADVIIETGVTQVQISIDGSTKGTYEYIRRGANFEKLIKNISYLNEEKIRRSSEMPKLQFNVVLMRSNLEELDGFVDLAETLGVEWIAARHVLVMKGLGVESESLFHEPELANFFFDRFLQRAARSNLVDVISFPDFFDVEAMKSAMMARRIVAFDRPFGVVDAPDATMPASTWPVSVNGWALDAEKLIGVTVEREPFPGDPSESLNERGFVHVMDARLGLERGDVDSLYQDFPGSRYAGWSAEILKEDLPEDHPGAVKFHVFAFALGREPAHLGEFRAQFEHAVRKVRSRTLRANR
jgi:MoaA/NifB/PqqE/SkfB family radical SAM enzyme